MWKSTLVICVFLAHFVTNLHSRFVVDTVAPLEILGMHFAKLEVRNTLEIRLFLAPFVTYCPSHFVVDTVAPLEILGTHFAKLDIVSSYWLI